ncbi:hypothetical protein HDV00_009636 [Rhizophlyctis rosea]|nr:hypothetical protein HDV00_009636 [Rhizophlyctis rosea]
MDLDSQSLTTSKPNLIENIEGGSDDKLLKLSFDDAKLDGKSIKVVVSFRCDTKKADTAKYVTSPPINDIHEILWTTPIGCGEKYTQKPGDIKGGTSFIGILFYLLLTLFGIYLVAGSAYNYFVLRIRRFPDMIPNYEMWSNLLAIAWDFVASLWERVAGRRYVSL